MREYDLHNLLEELGLHKVRSLQGNKGLNFMFCCPFHGERKPSAGIHIEGYGQCFACGEKFSLAKLVAKCKGVSFDAAQAYLEERYNVKRKTVGNGLVIKRYGEIEKAEKRFELPKFKLAPFRSGKEIHNYFFDRGLTEKTAQKFMVGWDSKQKRITVPIFYYDNVLAGFIGRAITDDPEKYYRIYKEAPKYFIYERFPLKGVFFGENVYDGNDTAIIVEGTFDLMWMHQLGFTNTLSCMIANFPQRSEAPAMLSRLGIKKVVLMLDNDFAGSAGTHNAYESLKHHFLLYSVEYPENTKDPMDLDVLDIRNMLKNKKLYVSF